MRRFANDLVDALFVTSLVAINAIWIVPLIAILGANAVLGVIYDEIKDALEESQRRAP